jgi:hypothetical protein
MATTTKAEPATAALGKFIDREVEKYLRQLGLKDMRAFMREFKPFDTDDLLPDASALYDNVAPPIHFRLLVLEHLHLLDWDGRYELHLADECLREIRQHLPKALKRALSNRESKQTRRQVLAAAAAQRKAMDEDWETTCAQIEARSASEKFAEAISGEAA